MTAKLLRIGELAERAGVSTRTVDFYTGLGLLVPARRTGGNFRLYAAADVGRIGLIRRLEAQGIRLEDIARALNAPGPAGSAAVADRPAGHGTAADGAASVRTAAGSVAVTGAATAGVAADGITADGTARDWSADGPGHPLSLEELEEQIRALREVAARADPRALGVLATLTARAQALIATAVVLAGELVGDIELPPL